MTNCDVKVAFKASRQDSEDLVGELFAGEFHSTELKDEIHHTVLLPRESTRKVVSRSASRSNTVGTVSSEGETESSGYGSGSSHSRGSGSATHIIPGDGLLQPMQVQATTESVSDSSSGTEFSTSASGWSLSHSDISSETQSESNSESLVPFYEYLREQELSSRQFYTVDEIRERYIAWIMCQPQRHAHIKLGDDKAIPLFISHVDEVRARDKDCQKVIACSNQKYALPAATVDGLMQQRRLQIVQSDAVVIDVEHEEHLIANQRWQKPDNNQPTNNHS